MIRRACVTYWPDIRAGWHEARRTDVGPRMTMRDAWRCGHWDYRLGFIAARGVVL